MIHRSLTISLTFLILLWGCGEETGGPRNNGGSSGTAGTTGAGGSTGSGGGSGCTGLLGCGGTNGSGGTAGSGGIVGSGGTVGSGGAGGSAGTGGSAGAGGTAGTAGSGGAGEACVTNDLCTACPSESDASCDCSPGEVCVTSGCLTLEGGDPIMACWPGPGGACTTNDDCAAEYECVSVGFGKSQCVKTTPGCNTTDDCVMGFSCEGVPGDCVDRRVPCEDFSDCPEGHICKTLPNSEFCLRVNRGCDDDADCSDVGAPWCADIDGDGTTECAGTPNPNDVPPAPACANDDCGGSTPVCEVADISSLATCGQYGLCQLDTDCASGFVCLGLWPDGRKECVHETGGTCSHISDCDPREVCASPRGGGPPSCQRGSAP